MREVHTTVNNIPMADKKPTEIASLGEFGLIDRLTDSFSVRNASTLRGVGDDAAVIGRFRPDLFPPQASGLQGCRRGRQRPAGDERTS